MQSGTLRHRVQLQRNDTTTNSLGEAVDGWVTYDERWCRIEPLVGRELQVQVQISADVTHKITMRWRDGVSPKHRILFGERVFEIDSVLNLDERGREMRIMCHEALGASE